jgi:hypothetical protein
MNNDYMSRLESDLNLEYGNGSYTVVIIKNSGKYIPILLDRPIYKIIKKLNYYWYVNDKDHIYTIKKHTYKNEIYDEYVYLHDLVMKLGKTGILQKGIKNTDELIKYMRYALQSDKTKKYDKNYPITHINKINFDNRYVNLQYDSLDKDYVKNVKKKKRTIDLKRYNIIVDDLPTYVWYLKPDKSHGGRFCIEIPDEISWRSTSSKRLSLRYKLEEVKKYLRYLKKIRPDIFDYFSMNGDLNLKGKTLLKEYNKMIGRAGYTIPVSNINNTNLFIKKDLSDLSPEEIYVLYSFNPLKETVNVGKALKEYYTSIKN